MPFTTLSCAFSLFGHWQRKYFGVNTHFAEQHIYVCNMYVLARTGNSLINFFELDHLLNITHMCFGSESRELARERERARGRGRVKAREKDCYCDFCRGERRKRRRGRTQKQSKA